MKQPGCASTSTSCGDKEFTMPVKQLGPRKPTGKAMDLRDRLIAEWRNPDSRAAQPIILEERTGHDQPIHVYVVWDDWVAIGNIERSEVIMDAFEQRYG